MAVATKQGPVQATSATEQYQRVGVGAIAWTEESEAYLKSRGWEKLGYTDRGQSVWADPNSIDQKPQVLPAITLPVQGGGTEVVMQTYCPPGPWNFTMEEALILQRQRDRAGEAPRQLIERKERELKELKARLVASSEVQGKN